MAGGSQAFSAQLAMEPGASPHTFDGSSELYRFNGEVVGREQDWIVDDYFNGTQLLTTDLIVGPSFVRGAIRLRNRPAPMDILWERILGGAEIADVFSLADEVPYFGLLVDRVGGTFKYNDCKISRTVIRGRSSAMQGDSPQPIEVLLEILGKSRDEGPTGPAFPSLAHAVTDDEKPYIFEQGVLNLLGGARDIVEFVLVIDNRQRPQFYNSLTPSDICTVGKKSVTLAARIKYTSTEHSALVDQMEGGVACSLVLTNGGMSTTITFGKVHEYGPDPNVRQRGEIYLPVNLVATKDGANDMISVTHDPVP